MSAAAALMARFRADIYAHCYAVLEETGELPDATGIKLAAVAEVTDTGCNIVFTATMPDGYSYTDREPMTWREVEEIKARARPWREPAEEVREWLLSF